MYNRKEIERFVAYIKKYDGISDKYKLASIVQKTFNLIRDRSVFYGEDFAVRFCYTTQKSFSNGVLSLSVLQKYDNKPFICCLVTPTENILFLINSTFLKKVSHSSQDLRVDNIRGTFLGNDIIRVFEGVINEPKNFEFLFTSHENYTFSENLERLVEATNNIHPKGKRFEPSTIELNCILQSVSRAISFMNSSDYDKLNYDLQNRVNKVSSEITIAAFIDNVNLRGRIIEHLITSADNLHSTLIEALHNGTPLPNIYTADKLGDYEREFESFYTATDIKTKILFLSSNPKGYNIDKLLSFLACEKSVYLIYIVTINENKKISTRLCSMYNSQLLTNTRIMKHWAGRNSRGVTQFNGEALESIVSNFDNNIDIENAMKFIMHCINE